MPYADTDFFIGLANSADRLHGAAMTAYQTYRGKIYTSLAVIIEIAIVSVRGKRPVVQAVRDVISVAALHDAYADNVLAAAHLIDRYGITVFDAFHAALCGGEIISSDHVYDRFEIKRIKLE